MDKYISGSSKYSCFICWVLCFLCNATRLEIEQTVWLQKKLLSGYQELTLGIKPAHGLALSSFSLIQWLPLCMLCLSLPLFI